MAFGGRRAQQAALATWMGNDSALVKRPGLQFCWLCGRTAPPNNWYGPWWLQIAHIASGQGRAKRVDDARAVVLLCSLCHELHVSDCTRLTHKTICGSAYPTIDERHTLWLKKYFDPEYYDESFLGRIWIGIPPDPERPPYYWLQEMSKNQGVVL
jgi:hypothetical protein